MNERKNRWEKIKPNQTKPGTTTATATTTIKNSKHRNALSTEVEGGGWGGILWRMKEMYSSYRNPPLVELACKLLELGKETNRNYVE